MFHGRNERRGISVIELLTAIAILSILFALSAAAVQRARWSAERARCQSHLRQIGLGLHQHHAAHGALPPGLSKGRDDPYPYMSWLTRILPHIEQQGLWQQAEAAFRQDLDFLKAPPHPLREVVVLYGCPLDGRILSPGTGSLPSRGLTSYLGAEGLDGFRKGGVLFLNSKVRLSDVSDGTSQTLMAGERPPSPDQRLGWWYAGWGYNQEGSAEVVLGAAERNVSGYSPGCPVGPYTFRQGSLRDPCAIYHFWSLHPGGANFLLCDGAVRFITYSADAVLPALATRAGGETAQVPD
jgi:prepilin-type processing-associated H-X9-DG protein